MSSLYIWMLFYYMMSLSYGPILLTSVLIFLGLCVTTSLSGIFACRRYLHLLQLESYQLDGYARSCKRGFSANTKSLWVISGIVFVIDIAWFLFSAFGPLVPDLFFFGVPPVVTIGYFVAVAWDSVKKARQAQKKPMVMTDRLKRLFVRHILITVVFCVAMIVVVSVLFIGLIYLLGSALTSIYLQYFLMVLFSIPACYLPLLLQPRLLALSAKSIQKQEERINQGFIDDAKRIIEQRDDLIRIGITGSFGKTSTKFILGDILKEKYNVLVPPSSYNTPMGVTRVIREQLLPEHEVYICEMGARRVGEIEELCQIAKPKYGILTNIGKQHLETFGTLENIVKTKYELAQSLPEDGVAFFPKDGGECEKLYHAHEGAKRLFGMGEDPELFVRAEQVEVHAEGSAFDLVTQDGQRISCTTCLLGEHNIMNILGCAAVAYEMGLSLTQIASGIAKAQPVEHRLQLINPGTGVIVIDDAFNSNPTGVQAAMAVLEKFQGRKICITPGMVELGEEEEHENFVFGCRMANVCDIVILVGKKHTEPIQRGLRDSKFDLQNMYVVGSLDDASAMLSTMTQPGDIVLFENDLPDNYNEK